MAQAQPTKPSIMPPPPPVPGVIFSQLDQGYTGGTVALLRNLAKKLNDSLHYASQGKYYFQDIMDNNADLSGADPDERNIGILCKIVYETFLNKRAPFTKPVDPTTIHKWADNIISSSSYNALTKIPPTSVLSIKIGGNLKSILLDYMNQIKNQNPINQ
jgi:hypothetical protein